MLPLLQSYIEPWILFLAEDPMLRLLQLSMIAAGGFGVFFVFYATRDILLRTQSFVYMFFCILLVAVVPVIGFLLYLLIRPQRTIKEREIEDMLRQLLDKKAPKKSSSTSSSKKS